jgi:hypothetical protein
MLIEFNNSTEVFFFIIFCSIYVCSILWIYGDAATRDMGVKGGILPLIFVIAAALALAKNALLALYGWPLGYWTLLAWPIGYIAWFIVRPKTAHTITE